VRIAVDATARDEAVQIAHELQDIDAPQPGLSLMGCQQVRHAAGECSLNSGTIYAGGTVVGLECGAHGAPRVDLSTGGEGRGDDPLVFVLGAHGWLPSAVRATFERGAAWVALGWNL
jgi:hypothetical protein